MMKKKEVDNQLDDLRTRINILDDKLLELLNERAKIVIEIGNIKKNQNLEIFQPQREEKVIKRIKAKSEIFPKESIESIWKEIISASKLIQGRIDAIGYLGPEGTFTHQAALEFFPKAGSKFIPCKNIIEIFENIQKKNLDFGVIPIENSLQGTVRETLDLLIEKDLFIYGEIELRIIQNLISIKNSDISMIKAIYSHTQAFAQTSSWLKANLPLAKKINVNSTAEGVKMVKKQNQKNIAAIGTSFAADFYGLKVLSSHIEDIPSNFTRFLIISNRENQAKKDKVKTSIVYVVKDVPGALFNVLEIFAKANINLLKIESRPRRKGRWEYIFYMDFEGDKNDKRIQEVFKVLKQNVIWYKILGSYPRS